MKILFLIRSLDVGGAERQLIELVRHLDKSRFQPVVVTFYDGGDLRNELENNQGITLLSLGKGGRWDVIYFLKRLMDIIHREKPDVIHGYLDVANLFALLAGRLSGKKVVWGLRASNMDLSQFDWTAGFIFRLAAMLSFFPDRIIVNSNAGLEYHLRQGYYSKRMGVVPNGIDTSRYYPDLAAGKKLRQKWGIGNDMILIGQVSRLDPVKDPENFLKAAAILSPKYPDARFIYVGGGSTSYRQQLEKMGNDIGLTGKLLWAGPQLDMRVVYNAFDIFSLSSPSEGFPNVVAEAMACSVPCVVTNVGDAAQLVGETGIVVPPQNASALAEGFEKSIQNGTPNRLEIGLQARQRIENLYSVRTLTIKTQNIILDLFASP